MIVLSNPSYTDYVPGPTELSIIFNGPLPVSFVACGMVITEDASLIPPPTNSPTPSSTPTPTFFSTTWTTTALGKTTQQIHLKQILTLQKML